MNASKPKMNHTSIAFLICRALAREWSFRRIREEAVNPTSVTATRGINHIETRLKYNGRRVSTTVTK